MGLDGIIYSGPIADIGSSIIIFFFAAAEMKKLNAKVKAEKIPEI